MPDHSDPKIYTRTGDTGGTSLFDGTRVSKTDPRIEATGDVDELASLLGVVVGQLSDAELTRWLPRIQRDLFAMGAMLADPAHRIASRVEKATLVPADVTRLEAWIDALEARLPPLRHFILPGGAAAGAALHLARSVCRRAERRIVSIGAGTDPVVLAYINRLSDLLFVMARHVNAALGVAETEW